MDTSLKDFKLILWNIPAQLVPQMPGEVMNLDIDQSSTPALVDMMNNGWRINSHTVLPISDGGLLLSLFMERDVNFPDGI